MQFGEKNVSAWWQEGSNKSEMHVGERPTTKKRIEKLYLEE